MSLTSPLCRPPPVAAVRHDTPGPHAFGGSDLAERLARCRAAAATATADVRPFCLQLFDLARLRARIGWRWEALGPRALELLQGGLQRELGPADLLVDDGADRLFLVRATADRRQAERHAELLAAEVTARLCGTIPGGASIRVVTLPFDPALELADTTTVAGLRDRLAHVARGPVHDAPAWLEPPGIRARYRPVLHLRKRLVSAYSLAALVEAPAIDGGDDIDGWVVRRAAELLQPRRHRAEPALIVPLHHTSLASMRSRERLGQLCRELPARAHRQLVVELVGLPPDLPQPRARELVAWLRPFCLAVLVRLERPESGIAHLAGTGTRGVSCVLPHELAVEGGQACLADLAGRARSGGLRTMLADVDGPRLCRWAAAAGIDHVCGDGLLPPMARPGRAFRVA